MKLSADLLNAGRTDNYYTSLELANKLLDNKTHLLGTLRSNRRGNPKEVIYKKLKRGNLEKKITVAYVYLNGKIGGMF